MHPIIYINWLFILLFTAFRIVAADAQTTTNEIKREWGQPAEGFVISITTSNKVFSSGESILLTVSFKNVWKKDVSVGVAIAANPFEFYDINVMLPNKKTCSLTPYGKQRMEHSKTGGSLRIVTLKPGEETSMTIPLNKIFDLSSRGKYTVSLTRKVQKLENNDVWTDLISNEIEITIDGALPQKQ